jgi:tRNA A-37 threonylcarbamoyl transferase component Bud32
MIWIQYKKFLFLSILALAFVDLVHLPAKELNQESQTIASLQNHFYQGEKYLEQGDYQKAEEQFVMAIRLMPQGPTATLSRIKIGFIYYRQNRYELARKELNIVVQTAPDNREARDYLQWIQWMDEGENAFNSGQFIIAHDNFQRVVQVDSTNLHARKQFNVSRNRGEALSYVQKFDEALALNKIPEAEAHLIQVEKYWKDYPKIEQLKMILTNLKSGTSSTTKTDPAALARPKRPEEQEKNAPIPLKTVEKGVIRDSIPSDSIQKTTNLVDTTQSNPPATASVKLDYSWLYLFVILIVILSGVVWYFRRYRRLKNKTKSVHFEAELAAHSPSSPIQNANTTPANGMKAAFIGKYEILEELEHGGMGRVVKARHPHFRQPVVIKSLLPEFTNHPVFRQRLFREANILFELDHPNIVRVTDLLEENAQVYIVMQYVDGKNLYQIVQENGPLKTEKAVPLFIQACQALTYLHEHKIIHRDIKPQNMMLLRNDEKIKLVDFGIVKPMTSDYGEQLTSASRIAGTPNFMSPEQLLNDEIDPRTDIFSLGISLFFSLTGTHPFEGYGISIMRAILEKVPQKLTAINPALSPAVEKICSTMMVHEREERFQTVAEIENALKTIAIHYEIPSI